MTFPVVSGNVSFYNESNGRSIPPTPVIGGVGKIDDIACHTPKCTRSGDAVFLLGETSGALGQSIYLRDILGRTDGPPPRVDLAAEKRNGLFVHKLLRKNRLVHNAHDLSDGGLLAAICEMALAADLGMQLATPQNIACAIDAFLFGEDQARYLITAPPANTATILRQAKASGVKIDLLGHCKGPVLSWAELFSIPLCKLRQAHESWLPDFMRS